MTDEKHTPHFPCGPCPALDKIEETIAYYREFSNNLRCQMEDSPGEVNHLVLIAQVSLLSGFATHLWEIFHLIKDSIETNKVEGEP